MNEICHRKRRAFFTNSLLQSRRPVRVAECNVLVNVLGVNVPLSSIRLLTPCCKNNLSQAPCSSCRSYLRTLRAEHPGVCHIKSHLFSLASSVVLSHWSLPLLHQQTSPLQSIQVDWLAFPYITFLVETGFEILLLILQPWMVSLFPEVHAHTQLPFYAWESM